MKRSYDAVICGAGICGISAAYFLSEMGMKNILLLDEGAPLNLTSSRSTECYRNWWADAEMLALMNRSIDLLEELAEKSGNIFSLNRRGYVYFTAQEESVTAMIQRAEKISALGAGAVRIHRTAGSAYEPHHAEGWKNSASGADILLGDELVQKYFPYINKNTIAALHVRRAGWMSAQQLGMYLLETAKKHGVSFEASRLNGIRTTGGKVSAVKLSNGEEIHTDIFINAAGPHLKSVGKMLGLDLPVYSELHLKTVFKDHLGAIQRDAPLLIWNDPQYLIWNEDEKNSLAEDADTKWLTEEFPSGAHTRPEGGADSQNVLMLWEYKTKISEPVFPTALDEQYPEIALRGMTTMISSLKKYFEKMPRPQIDGGYYTKTRENRLLASPLPITGAYVFGAVSGYGIMSACGAGELLAKHVTGSTLPSYAPAFNLNRYEDKEYMKSLDDWSESGQL